MAEPARFQFQVWNIRLPRCKFQIIGWIDTKSQTKISNDSSMSEATKSLNFGRKPLSRMVKHYRVRMLSRDSGIRRGGRHLPHGNSGTIPKGKRGIPSRE